MQTRQERIDHKWMPDGSIRGFDSDKGSGISEEQYTATAAPSDTVSTDPKRIKVLLTPQREELAKAKRRANNGVDDFADKRLLPKVDQSAADCLTVSSGSGNHGDQLICEPKIIDYSRDSKGRIANRHLLDHANTIHTCTGSGSDTDQYILSDPCSHAKEDPNPSPDHSPALRATDYKCPPIATQPGRVEYRIRKITPREAFRLMDVDEENIDRIQNHTWTTTTRKGEQKVNRISKTRQYALAGNSIVVACMERIFANLWDLLVSHRHEPDYLNFDDILIDI
ncbi:MAG: hypothetical protein LIO91_08150 [Bacteroidales bacterium]|nr:hypothetical protein [Bacteroidales bacterium]